MISALAYPDRVCGITFNMSPGRLQHSPKLLAAMNQPFPALKSLELNWPGFVELQTPPPFVMGQTSHLQSLNFIGSVTQLSRILPYTTSLVDLTLSLRTMFVSTDDTQLLVHLQGLSSLRRLKVDMWHAEMLGPPGGTGYARLPTLTSFSFTGSMDLLDAFMAGLAAPSLQELRISVISVYRTHDIRPLTHLTTFTHNPGRRVFSAQLNAPEHGINLVMSAHSHSTDDPPFKIIASGMHSILLLGDLFSEMLATVEDVFLASPFCLPIQDTSHTNTFFTPFCSAKIIRVSPGIESEVGAMFRNEELSPDLLPALEEIELNATMPSCTPIRIDKKEVVSVLDPFKPFMDARQRAGHPVKVHWNTDRGLPEYFCNAEM